MRKIIDSRGRLFGRISVIDIIVVIVVVVLVAAYFMKFYAIDTPLASRDTTEIRFTFTVGTVRLATADHLRVGDVLYWHDTGAYIGTIEHVEVTDAELTDTILDGTYVTASV